MFILLLRAELPSVSDKYRPFTSAPGHNLHTHPHRHHIQRPSQGVTYSPRTQMDRPNAKIYDGKAKDSNNQVKSTG
jgi:hypothetical protein